MVEFRASSAALAMENCGPNYKAVFAKPKHEDAPTSFSRHSESKSSYMIII